jgi:hypothetical protein
VSAQLMPCTAQVDALNRVCEARHNRISEERHTVSSFAFGFLSMLALFTFYGTLFLQFGSLALNVSVREDAVFVHPDYLRLMIDVRCAGRLSSCQPCRWWSLWRS